MLSVAVWRRQYISDRQTQHCGFGGGDNGRWGKVRVESATILFLFVSVTPFHCHSIKTLRFISWGAPRSFTAIIQPHWYLESYQQILIIAPSIMHLNAIKSAQAECVYTWALRPDICDAGGLESVCIEFYLSCRILSVPLNKNRPTSYQPKPQPAKS